MALFKGLASPTASPGILYGIGLGPGDSKWVTIEAASILNQLDQVAFITGRAQHCRAESIAEPFLSPKTDRLFLPMPPHTDVLAWQRVARQLSHHYHPDKKIGIACLGDPLLYGSISHILIHLDDLIPVRIIPGLWSGAVAAAALVLPWTTYQDSLTVIPATADEKSIRRALSHSSAAIILKVGGHEQKIYHILQERGDAYDCWLVSELGTAQQKCQPFVKPITTGSYFSLLWVKQHDNPIPKKRIE